MTRTLLLSLIAPLVIGCVSDASYQSASLDSEFILKPGGRAKVDDRFTLRFDTLAEDSRCPAGANCAWEGNAAMVLEYQSPDHPPIDFRLNTAERFAGDTTIQSYRIMLVEVEPAAESNRTIGPDDYSVKLRVERP